LDENRELELGEPPRDGDARGHERRRVELQGILQGVGFRPYVYRLARTHELGGWVRNDPHGVTLELEGLPRNIQDFLRELPRSLPSAAAISSLIQHRRPSRGERFFAILDSDPATIAKGPPTAAILADLAPCPACLAETADTGNRRYGYPFTNCTQCGPRFSIVESLPYDRERTTMRHFAMCSACREEYENPENRRFHAQPNACPECGPQLTWCDAQGEPLSVGQAVLGAAADALVAGHIVALKGVGGFQLLADAGNADAVQLLRRRKGRPTKPFAVMVGSLADARKICKVSSLEADLLSSAPAPIVLLDRIQVSDRVPVLSVVEPVAPNQRRLGLMLPSSPLHDLLLKRVGFPLIATSGNLHSEPICTDNEEAFLRLEGIADYFVVHDRPVARPVDDSVAVVRGEETRLWRRARGYAPLPIALHGGEESIVAVGGDQKNTLALLVGDRVVLSQHLGDLGSDRALLTWRKVLADFLRIYSIRPGIIAHDAHPDYHSTRLAQLVAEEFPAARTVAVQHHHAHLASCLAEHAASPDEEVLGVIWDGTGYGADGTIWGGEFLRGSLREYQRAAAWRAFPLLGGERAIQQPGRVALALLWQVLGRRVWQTPVGQVFPASQRQTLELMLATGRYSVETSSVGRLFDGLAGLFDPSREVHYSGEAAMAVEMLADEVLSRGVAHAEWQNWELTVRDRPKSPPPGNANTRGRSRAEWYEVPMETDEWGLLRLDWRPLMRGAHGDLRRGDAAAKIAARFHHTLANSILEVARHVALPRVVLSGGCFQNRQLTDMTVRLLRTSGFAVLLHRLVPPNDGGLSLGQVAVARYGDRT
jgi:hydrogenase maturation protein HypF